MSRTTKALVIALLLAIVPLRGLAAVTVGFCAMGHHDSAPAAHDHDGHDDHGHAPEPVGGTDCSICVEHCSSASFAVPAALETFVSIQRSGRIGLGAVFAAGFVPDHLDPPPLAL